MGDLINWDEFGRMIDTERDIKILVQMQEQMEAVRVFAKQADGGLKMQNKCALYRIKIERRIGQIFKDLPDEKGTRTDLTLVHDTSKLKAIKTTGKDRSTLNRWVKEAEIDGDMIKEYGSICKKENKEMTTAGLLNYSNQQQEPVEPPPMQKGIYRIIYADPPWKYTEQGLTGVSDTYNRGDEYGNVEKHYPQLTIKELCEMELPKTEDNAVLFLWVTSPFLMKSNQVIEAWGFKYKSLFVWDKIKHNFGYYNSVRQELLLICTKGSCRPDSKELIDSVQSIERTKHSVKPEEFRNIIDILYPQGNRIELFARKKTTGWEAWGYGIEQ